MDIPWKALTPALCFAPAPPSPKFWERGPGGEGLIGSYAGGYHV
jgi:hypothetical protein